tara:strand:+ start:408 stop:671 length:264 start_codon:yes stop_codon:yes gene_type:complete
MREIEAISYLVGKDPKPNGSSGFNWLAKTYDGYRISLYYDMSRPKRDHHWVEAYDPSDHLGLSANSYSDIVGINIVDLPKYFDRNEP